MKLFPVFHKVQNDIGLLHNQHAIVQTLIAEAMSIKSSMLRMLSIKAPSKATRARRTRAVVLRSSGTGTRQCMNRSKKLPMGSISSMRLTRLFLAPAPAAVVVAAAAGAAAAVLLLDDGVKKSLATMRQPWKRATREWHIVSRRA
jgi:anti-sigma factor RsiW